MSPADKKSIIDKIFGFYVINEMRDLLKDESKAIKENMARLSGEVDGLTRTLSRTQEELQSLSEKIKEDSKGKTEDLEEKISKFSSLLDMHKEKVSQFNLLETGISDQVKSAYRAVTTAKESKRTIEQKIRLYENDKCPTCTTDLSGSFHQGLKDELNKQLSDFNSVIDSHQENYDTALKKEAEIRKEKTSITEKGNKIIVNINSIKEELKKLKSVSAVRGLDSLKKISEDTRESIQEFSQERSKEEKKSTLSTSSTTTSLQPTTKRFWNSLPNPTNLSTNSFLDFLFLA
jgi:DNA repair exonuclease SbcCD ATPase subunit